MPFSYTPAMVDRQQLPSREDRERYLAEAGYNVFNLDASQVYVDLLTDSGTGTMSTEQWGALLQGDESYAGSTSFGAFEDAVQDVTGFDYVIPTHQGRGAENVLYGNVVAAGDHVLGNTHFDTTRAHIANNNGVPVNLPVDPETRNRFKGDMAVDDADAYVTEVGEETVSTVVLTITNNSFAGQPVSMENTRRVAAFADDIDALFVIDACRFAENAYLIQQYEDGYEHVPAADIAAEQLEYADALTMSLKKDGLVNIGGLVATDDEELYDEAKQRAILYEGFPTYGGMAGRDLAAAAVGLREAVDDDYLAARVGQVQELGDMLQERDIPIFEPVGGHAVYIDADQMFPHIPDEQFPGQALVTELYREGGVRSVELGGFAFPGHDGPNFVRLALPRRTYHQEHLEHVADTVEAVYRRRRSVSGLEIVDAPEMEDVRHFLAELRPVE